MENLVKLRTAVLEDLQHRTFDSMAHVILQVGTEESSRDQMHQAVALYVRQKYDAIRLQIFSAYYR